MTQIPHNDDWRKSTPQLNAQFTEYTKKFAPAILMAAIGLFAGYLLFGGGDDAYWNDGYITNVFTEFISLGLGIAITVTILDYRNEKRADNRRKRQLKIHVGSAVNSIAVAALEEIVAEKWSEIFHDKDTWLWGANWTGAYIPGINLQRTWLEKTVLEDVNFSSANLEQTILIDASLNKAYLSGANLTDAYLDGATFEGVVCDAQTILPDGTNYDPKKGIEQMERFTNPEHPEFWQPEWVKEWDATGNPPEWLAQWYEDES